MKLYLRLCLIFAFLSLAVYFSKTYFFNHNVVMSIEESFPAEDHYSRHKTAAFMNLSMPSCLQKWRERDLLLVRQRVQETYPDMLSSSLSSPCPQALAAPHFYAAFHQPHFSEYFFTFLSLMLWQSDVFPPRNVTSSSSTLPCIRYMGIPDEITEFWRDQKEGRKTWVMQLISAMKPFLSESFFLSSNLARRLSIPLMKHHILPFENSSLALYRWFLHPSDASWLTSKLLQHDPCIDKAKSLLNSGLSVKILQRRGAREMVNTEEVINSVRSNGVALKSIEMIDFESSSLLQQAQQMYGSDVLITVHGAGQTNIVFMKVQTSICPPSYK